MPIPTTDEVVYQLLRATHHMTPELEDLWREMPPPPQNGGLQSEGTKDTETKTPE